MTDERSGGESSEYPTTLSPAERVAAAASARVHGLKWTPLEIVPAAIVTAVVLYAVCDVVAGVVEAVTIGSLGVGITLLQSTAWAEPVLAAALLGAAVVCWSEVKRDAEDLDFYATSDDEVAAGEIDPGESVGRLLRSRFLSTCTVALTVLAAAGSVGTVVGAVIEQRGAFNGQRWAPLIGSCGIALAVCVLAAACFVIVVRTHREATAILGLTEDEAADRSVVTAGE